MPWGPLSIVKMQTPEESNDGPILWIRPGEQLVPTVDRPLKRRRLFFAFTIMFFIWFVKDINYKYIMLMFKTINIPYFYGGPIGLQFN